MVWLKGFPQRSWWLANLSIGGLLLAIAVAGLFAIGINDRVRDVLVRAIQYDLEIEERADDLRLAVLDMRHYHRNIIFGGPSPRELDDFELAYQQLLVHIDALQELGIDAPNLLSAEEMRAIAEEYYAHFRPAIDQYDTNRRAFEVASDDGLWRLADLENDAQRIERFGERQAATALEGVQAAAESASYLLFAKLGGYILIGAGLALLIMRNLREQRKAASELARALQIKSDFIADMSHELRTPLTVLRANAEVALALDGPCTHTDLLKEIVQESEQMTQLIEDLLFLARSDAGALPLAWELVHIQVFLVEVAERARALARQYEASIQTDFQAEGLVHVDRARLLQALLILVDNAGKYSPSQTTITLRSLLAGDVIVIEVADQGPGIPAADLPFIFERFYRVDKARTRKLGGVGLGLAIAKSIITIHGGRVEAESALNIGTKIRYYLPLASLPHSASALPKPKIIGEAV